MVAESTSRKPTGTYEAIVRNTLAESVYEVLLESILSGRLESGTELSIVALARELDVSRTPVHEALRQLARDGLIVQETNRKARVAVFDADDVHEIFEMRKLLEGAAARAAATRIVAADVARLRATADFLLKNPGAVDWSERWVAFDEDFHATIAQASGSKRLAEDIARYRLLHRGFNRMGTEPVGLQSALREHVAILDALAARDAETAGRAMVDHVAAWQTHFVKRFQR